MWFSSSIVLVSGLAIVSSISPAFGATFVPYVLHEKREVLPQAWAFDSPANSSTILPVKIGLIQSNLDQGHDLLMAVSAPNSPTYGQHWTPIEVAAFFEPAVATINAVRAWLVDAGVNAQRINLSKGKTWLTFDATVEELESLLETKFAVYRHPSGRTYIGTQSYRIPASLKESIDFITPTVQFDVAAKVATYAKRDIFNPRHNEQFSPKLQGPIIPKIDIGGLNDCGSQITPACLRAMYVIRSIDCVLRRELPNKRNRYGIPKGQFNDSKNSYGIVEFAPQTYRQEDLDIFFNTYAPTATNSTPVYLPIDGGYLSPELDSGTIGESNLDLEYAMSLVYPQAVTLYQTGDDVLFQPATNNNFLDAIDGSYCTYDGGDNSDWDAIYPHNFSTTGYQGQPDCGTYKPTKVMSVKLSHAPFRHWN
jgi:tripeptidyl-peptidase-1